MNESNKAPTSASTSPLGNTGRVQPTPLSTHINPYIREKLKDNRDANRRAQQHLRLKETHSGHARD
jgi:hypothetical protein